jgi:6-phosphogluconolactonase
MGKYVTYLIIYIVFLSLYSGFAKPQQGKEIIYAGTFSDQGLLVLEFDRENRSFTEIQRISDIEGPNFQSLHPNREFLYSVSSQGVTDDDEYGSVSAYRIDPETGQLTFLNIRSAEGRGPCHISIDPEGRFAFVSNYSSGNIAVYPILEDGTLGEVVDVVQHEGSSIHSRQQEPHMHSIIPSDDNEFIYASDLGIDMVKIYRVDQESGKLTPADNPHVENVPGSGPRHFTIHPDGEYTYSVEELSSTVAAFSVDPATGALEQFQRVEMLPADFSGTSTAADIHISPDGQFLYATNRGHDSIAIFSIDESSGSLSFVGREPTRGGHPRNFAIDKLGEFVFVANRDDDNIVLFERDNASGLLTYTGIEADVPRVVCVTQLFLE